MSLINDALKRAKESHGQTPPPPPDSSGMRPVDKGPSVGMPAWVWVIVIVLLVGGGAFLIGQATHKNPESTKTELVEAAKEPVKAAPMESQAEPVPVRATGAGANAVAAAPPVPTKAEPVKVPEKVIPATGATAATPEPAAVVFTEPAAKPAVAPLKLQSIIYDPRRPSAVVSGKLLFLGDHINGLTVLKIQKNSIFLVGAGQTNVLELEN